MYEIIKNEGIPLELDGKIIDIVSYKGGNTTLTVKNKNEHKSAAFDERFDGLIQLGDSIKKEPYTNKCLIIRKDSVFFLDCYKLDENLKDSFPGLSEWNKKIKGRWISKNNPEIEKLVEL